MKSLASTIAMLLIVLFIAPLDAMAADKQQFCNDYATKAVEQYNLGKQHKLPGVVPPAWSNDRNGHYNWCMAVPENFANSENTKRQAYLDKNIARTAPVNQTAFGVTVGKMAEVLDMGKVVDFAIAQGNQSYIGCFKDQKNRDLAGYSFHAPNMTKELCMTTCQQKGFQYAGLQYSRYCFCGNTYGKSGKANNCNMPCAGNKSETCGGGWANSVYSVKGTEEKPVVAAGNIAIPTANKPIQKLSLYKPINLVSVQNILSTRVYSKSKVLLSPMESPIFDVPVFQRSQAVEIGRGYNSLLKTPKLPALMPIPASKIKRLSANVLSSSSGYVRDTEEYYKHLGVDVGVSGSYLFASGSTLSQFESNSQSNRYTETYVATADLETYLEFPTLTEIKLNPTALNVLKNQGIQSFYQQYGDSFIYAIQYGAGIKGSASYKLYNSGEHITFTNTTKIGANAITWSANIKTKVEKESRQKKERETRAILVDSYGFIYPHPNNIKELQQNIHDFSNRATDFAKQANNSNEYGGIVRYTVIKYSNLPEFQQITGGPDKLNLVDARKLLDKLLFFQRKFERMKNNLNYIINNPQEFKAKTVSDAQSILKQKMKPLLVSINNDIGQIQYDPFNKQLLNGINIDQYRSVPDYAPSSKYVKVTIDFPAKYTDSAQARQGGKSQEEYWDDHMGPLIGFNLVKGDADVYSNCCIDVNINTKLEIRDNQQNAYVIQHFREHENKGDHTTIEGTKRLLVYTAPKNYKIIGFKQNKADYYHLRNLRGENRAGGPVFNVLEGVPSKPNDLWSDLHVIIDNSGGDFPYVGLFGKMTIFVEIQEMVPKE